MTLTGRWQKVQFQVACAQAPGIPVSIRLTALSAERNIYLDDMVISEIHGNPWAPAGDGAVSDNLFGLHTQKIDAASWRWPPWASTWCACGTAGRSGSGSSPPRTDGTGATARSANGWR
nr:hypothetical protein GCM10020093_018360 [Planobispora longispora]